MLKKRGVCKWRAVAERSALVEERLAKSRKLRLQRLFDGWWNNLDRMAISKSRSIMQYELNKRIQLRRGMTALFMNTEEKRH